MKVIRFIDKYLEEILCAFLLAAMAVVVIAQIILRALEMPLSWSEEMARYMFIWLIYVGAAYAIKKRAHIKVEILTLLVKDRGQYVLDLISDLGFLFFAVVISFFGWNATYKIAFVNVQQSPAMHLNMGIAYLSVCLGCTLMAIRLVQDIILRTKERKAEKASKAYKEVNA